MFAARCEIAFSQQPRRAGSKAWSVLTIIGLLMGPAGSADAKPMKGASAAPSQAAQRAQENAAKAAAAATNALKRATLAIQAQQASQKAARDSVCRTENSYNFRSTARN